MSTKVGVIDHPGNQVSRHVKRAVAQLLVRRLLYEWVRRDAIRKLEIREPLKIQAQPNLDSYSPPSQSVHTSMVRWQPPKNSLTALKPHPFNQMNEDELVESQFCRA